MSDDKKATIRAKKLQIRQALLTVLQGLSEAEWETAVYAEDTHWTVSDIVRHLVNAEKGMTGLITHFQQGNNPVPLDFDRERYNQRIIQKTKEKSPVELLAEIEKNQATFLAVLDSIKEEDWQKNGRHASLRIMTIEEVCHLIPDHELTHLEHIKVALRNKDSR